MEIDHIYETLKTGIDILAGSTGTIQQRLWETWMVIRTLEPDDFPLDLRDVFRKISDALIFQQSAIDAKVEIPTIDDAPQAYEGLNDERARELALSIVQLFAETSAQFWPTHKQWKP